MMTQPSTARLIGVIRVQLSEIIGPALPEGGPLSTLGMIDHVLQTIQIRAENEIDWMTRQTADVIGLAERAVSNGEVSATLSDAVRKIRAGSSGGLTTSQVTAAYADAAAVLSQLLEETVDACTDTAVGARALLEREVQWGVDVVGNFVLVAP